MAAMVGASPVRFGGVLQVLGGQLVDKSTDRVPKAASAGLRRGGCTNRQVRATPYCRAMPGINPPRTKLQRIGLARVRDIRLKVASDLRDMRADSGLSRRAVARHAGVSASTLRLVEESDQDPGIEVLARVAAVLGCQLDIRLRPGAGPLVRDHLQLAMLQALLAVLHPRWKASIEVAVHRPVRGVIDLVLDDLDQGTVIAAEAQSDIRRAEQQVRWANLKADALSEARALGEAALPVSRLLLLRSTQHTRAVVALAPDVFAAAYPTRAADAFAALTGAGEWRGASVVWCNVVGGVARILSTPPRAIAVGR
jgi:transcriptional regulator with XRE-family HTH domain